MGMSEEMYGVPVFNNHLNNRAEKTEAQRRKENPMYAGLLVYFPDALEEVSHVSFIGNQQHNPGQPLHWAKEKSSDEPDALMRHLTDRARGEKFDTDGVRHLAKAAWRALANVQREIDAEKEAVNRVKGSR